MQVSQLLSNLSRNSSKVVSPVDVIRANLQYQVRKLQTKQPPSALKWRKMIGKLEHQMLVDDEQNDYRKMIEMRR